ncbi:hypothetical protein F5Y01DRAFT_203887 [Xylaria sp. FL0043]|nr:hypothetical protein F5Y01DRAFT_203887 [Xylaria sp. FL0043]
MCSTGSWNHTRAYSVVYLICMPLSISLGCELTYAVSQPGWREGNGKLRQPSFLKRGIFSLVYRPMRYWGIWPDRYSFSQLAYSQVLIGSTYSIASSKLPFLTLLRYLDLGFYTTSTGARTMSSPFAAQCINR